MTPSILGWMFTRQRSRRRFSIRRQADDGIDPRNESGNDPAVYSRAAWRLHVTFEEGTCAAWLHDLLKPHVSRVVVCDPRKNALLKAGNKNDRIDARKLADLLRSGLLSPVYHGENGIRTLKELARSYLAVTQDLTRVMKRLKALYRSWAIPCAGERVYAPRHREEWLEQDQRTRRAPPGGDLLSATRRIADSASCRCGTICWRKAESILR